MLLDLSPREPQVSCRVTLQGTDRPRGDKLMVGQPYQRRGHLMIVHAKGAWGF